MLTKIQSDLEAIANFDPSLWEGLKGKNIFATGCTGFIGAWLVYSFVYVNRKYKLNATLTLLTRNKEKLFSKYNMLRSEASVLVHEGDILDFNFPEGCFDFVIHGATDVAAFQSGESPSHLIDVSYNGTKKIIQFCQAKAVSKVLFLSSGAVYGPMSTEQNGYDEEYLSAPKTNSFKSSYGEAKRLSEMLLFNETSFQTVSARIFAICGPFLPMDSSYAFSNFFKDCLEGREIEIKSNGKSTRSYLYTSDLALWLWTLLLRGKDKESYNVGSEDEISISELASQMVKYLHSSSKIKILGQEKEFTRYFPQNGKIMQEFSLPEPISLKDAIVKTFNYYEGTL